MQKRLIAGRAYLARRGTPTSFQELARHDDLPKIKMVLDRVMGLLGEL
jgi:hypothetical protein